MVSTRATRPAAWGAAVLLSLPLALSAQFLPDEIAKRPYWESYLATARITKIEPIGEGVTHPYKLALIEAGVETTAAWKNPEGIQGGFLEGWRFEIAAYRLDKLMGLDMIPVTIERELEGRKGCLSLWADVAMNEVKRVERGLVPPPDREAAWTRAKYLSRAWDCLIANEDRTQQNLLYTSDWRTILIDHSRSFRSGGQFDRKLVYGRRGIKVAADGRPWLIRQVSRRFVAALKALTFESVRDAVGPYLEEREVRSVLTRRDLLLAEIDVMIRESGEDSVLYD